MARQRGAGFAAWVTGGALGLSAAAIVLIGVLVTGRLGGQVKGSVSLAVAFGAEPTATPTLPGPTPLPTGSALPSATAAPTLLSLVDPPPTRTPRPEVTRQPTAALSAADVPTDVPATPEPTSAPAGLPPYDPARPRLELINSPLVPGSLPEVALEVELFYAEHWMRVEQVVVARNTSADAWGEVVFNVPVAHKPGVFALDAVRASVGGGELAAVDASPDDTVLRVPLPRRAAQGETVRVELDFRILFEDVSAGSVFPEGLTGYTGSVTRAGEWYPVLAPYHDGEGWQAVRWHPAGDPIVYPAANYVMAVDAPAGVTVAGSGEQGLRGGAWRFRVEAGRGVAFFAGDSFYHVEGEANGIPITSYHLRGAERVAQATVQVAGEALQLFEELYGPYPYDSLVIVHNRTASDMEYSGLISLSNDVYYSYRAGRAATALHVLTAHEVAHQWWYGGVGTDQVREPWLDESLASYSEILYYERYHPDLAGWRLGVFEARHTPGALDLPITTFGSTTSYVRAIYSRGAVFLDSLREAMGDEAFFALLADFYGAHRGGSASGADFIALARERSPENIEGLLNRTFNAPGP